jgi:transcriptional regulator with XRE-family HTH domain
MIHLTIFMRRLILIRMDDLLDDFGDKLTNLRKAANLSQVQLAEEVGISQATISRLEATQTYSGDLVLVAKLARFFRIPLKELLPYLQADLTRDVFFAFCPNPLCIENTVTNEGLVDWSSFKEYPSGDFPDVNFCTTCGTPLCKECPSCQRKFVKFSLYCIRCGVRVCNRPTEEEAKMIERKREVLHGVLPF